MRKITVFLAVVCLMGLDSALAQQTEYELTVPNSEDYIDGYTTGIHSGARTVQGPHDLDGDGQLEILVSDYTGGGRVHVIENVGIDTWELVYSTPFVDSTASTNNARVFGAGDMDNDGHGEIYIFSGFDFTDTTAVPGLYVYEHDGTDNGFGDGPASIYDFPDDVPNRWRQEQIVVQDIDGDGFQELMFGNNGNNRHDNWYILSVTGDIGTGFEVWVQEARLSSRATEEFDPVNRGGGSPYSILPGDFDGDGTMDLMMHSWNNFNFTTGQVAGADSYTFPDTAAANSWIHATADDHVSFFGGVVVDIDGDGNDEIFYPRLQVGDISIINYDPGESPLEITEDNIVVGVIPAPFSSLGIEAGDLDGDGHMELFGSGASFTAEAWLAGETFSINVAEYIPGPGKAQAGDPEDPANYAVQSFDISMPHDTLDFDLIVRDSAGVITEYYETGVQGPEFVAKLAYLGDPDGDGQNELALSLQGVDDSTYVIDEVWSDVDSTYSRTVRAGTATANENRGFLRVVTAAGTNVSITDERVVLPSDYKLEPNYPNPFNPSTTFSFTLPLDKQISVKIYDATGRLVQTLINDQVYSKGTHQVTWDATGLASGTYLYTLEYGNFRQTRSMVLLK